MTLIAKTRTVEKILSSVLKKHTCDNNVRYSIKYSIYLLVLHAVVTFTTDCSLLL